MTIVCVLREPETGAFLLGSNSRTTVGDTVVPADLSKWQRFGDWALAFSGNGVPTEALERRRGKFPGDTEDPHEVAGFVAKALRRLEVGRSRDDGRDYQTSGLLVRRGLAAFDVDANLTVERLNEGAFWARGSGMDYALGAAHLATAQGLSPRAVVEAALAAAVALDTACPGAPIIEAF